MRQAVARRHGAGYTLVELLVVLSLLALLAAALLPAFASARERGRQAACTSNLRQIGLAMTMYAADQDRLLPPVSLNADDSQADAQAGLDHVHSQALIACVQPYVRPRAVWYCPDDSAAEGAWRGHRYRYDSSYRYHGALLARHPGMLSLDFSRGAPADGGAMVLLGEVCSPHWDNPWGDYSHSGRSNWLFRDGHVRALPIHSSFYDYPEPW